MKPETKAAVPFLEQYDADLAGWPAKDDGPAPKALRGRLMGILARLFDEDDDRHLFIEKLTGVKGGSTTKLSAAMVKSLLNLHSKNGDAAYYTIWAYVQAGAEEVQASTASPVRGSTPPPADPVVQEALDMGAEVTPAPPETGDPTEAKYDSDGLDTLPQCAVNASWYMRTPGGAVFLITYRDYDDGRMWSRAINGLNKLKEADWSPCDRSGNPPPTVITQRALMQAQAGPPPAQARQAAPTAGAPAGPPPQGAPSPAPARSPAQPAAPAAQAATGEELSMHIVKVGMAEPAKDGTPTIGLFISGHQWPDLRWSFGADRFVDEILPPVNEALRIAGANEWEPGHFQPYVKDGKLVNPEYTDIAWTVYYTLSQKLTSQGNPYKDVVRAEPAG